MAALQSSGIELPLDVSSFYHQLFCLKRDYSLSNLPSVQAIRVITTTKGEKARVAEINLFSPTGEVYLLELWNEDAAEGVKFLWEKLGSANEILFRIIDLDPSDPIKDKRLPVYKICNATSYQKEHKLFPVEFRIMVKNGSKDQYNDLRRQFRKIELNNQIQLMNGNDPLRDISLWHQTPEAQNEMNHPDELQQMIYRATALSVLGKRADGGSTNKETTIDTKATDAATKKGKSSHAANTANTAYTANTANTKP